MSRQLTFKSIKKPLSTEISEKMGLFSNFSLMLTKSFCNDFGASRSLLAQILSVSEAKVCNNPKEILLECQIIISQT